MKLGFIALTAVAAGLAGCGSVQPSASTSPYYEREMKDGRPGLFGDLNWNIDLGGGKKEAAAAPAKAAPAAQAATPAAASASEMDEFKKWRESMGSAERQEFEEWRAWQEWKRKNPK